MIKAHQDCPPDVGRCRTGVTCAADDAPLPRTSASRPRDKTLSARVATPLAIPRTAGSGGQGRTVRKARGHLAPGGGKDVHVLQDLLKVRHEQLIVLAFHPQPGRKGGAREWRG